MCWSAGTLWNRGGTSELLEQKGLYYAMWAASKVGAEREDGGAGEVTVVGRTGVSPVPAGRRKGPPLRRSREPGC